MTTIEAIRVDEKRVDLNRSPEKMTHYLKIDGSAPTMRTATIQASIIFIENGMPYDMKKGNECCTDGDFFMIKICDTATPPKSWETYWKPSDCTQVGNNATVELALESKYTREGQTKDPLPAARPGK